MVERIRDESGYSLVEVMVAIMLLTIAIVPMVGMFDTGLKVATQGSDYDKARALANKQMEMAKNLSYVTVRDDFPTGTGAPPYNGNVCGGNRGFGQDGGGLSWFRVQGAQSLCEARVNRDY